MGAVTFPAHVAIGEDEVLVVIPGVDGRHTAGTTSAINDIKVGRQEIRLKRADTV